MTDIHGPANAPNSTTTRPSDDRVFNSTDTWFKDCSSPVVDDGTAIKASWLNGIAAEMRTLTRSNGNLLSAAPVVPEANDDNMIKSAVLQLMQRGQMLYGVDSGTADAMVVTLSPAALEYKTGMEIRVTKAGSATTIYNPTINVNTLGAKVIVDSLGNNLPIGALRGGAMLTLRYDGTNFRVVSHTPLVLPNSFNAFCSLHLIYDNSALWLRPKYGDTIFIDGTFRSVPAAGVSISPGSITAGNVYYIYAYWTGSAVALEASGTVPVKDPTYSHMRKTGDAQRSYVGLSYCATNSQWSPLAELTASHYNASPHTAAAFNPSPSSTTSGTYVERASSRVTFVTDDGFFFGGVQMSVASDSGTITNQNLAGHIGLAVDVTTGPFGTTGVPRVHNPVFVPASSFVPAVLSRGVHFATIVYHAETSASQTVLIDNSQTFVQCNR